MAVTLFRSGAYLMSAVVVGALQFAPADARKRVREWDRVAACPTDAPVLVGSAGAAARFTALAACRDVQVVPEVDPRELVEADSGEYTVRGTKRDEDGKVAGNYRYAGLTDDADDDDGGVGDVRVVTGRTETGVQVVTIAPVRDENAGVATPARVRAPRLPVAPLMVPTPVAVAQPISLVGAATLPLDERVLALRPARTSAFDEQIAEVARRQRVDPLLLHAVIKQESAYRATVVSSAGAVGMMQLMPGTGRALGIAPGYLRHPRTNVEAGARLLRKLAGKYGNDFRLVLAAYNAGEGAVAKYGNQVPPYAETQDYVRRVLDDYSKLCAENGVAYAGAR